MQSVNAMALAFRAGILPKSEWTHEAHLKVGLWYVLHTQPDQVLGTLKTAICRYNLLCGVANTETSGYHETLTCFYLGLIQHFVSTIDPPHPVEDLDLDHLAQALIAHYGDRQLPLRYWNADRLFSAVARGQWIPPDRPCPFACPPGGQG